MADLTVRTLETSEIRAASTLFRRALHRPAPTDDEWPAAAASYEPGRSLGAFQGEHLIGTTGSYRSALAVPGGATVPMAAVTRVAVRADRTRRGALTALMREQLQRFAATGEPVATLRASEAQIYGRFGYGVATRGQGCAVRSGTALRPTAPTGGEIRLIDREDGERALPALYERIGLHRPGMIARPAGWWTMVLRHKLDGDDAQIAVHHGADGADGFAVYFAKHADNDRPALVVEDLHSADPIVVLHLWRFLLGIDLVQEVRCWLRPLDEPLEWLSADRRDYRTTGVEDETWLRLVDVPAALAARSYRDADPVVVEVTDRVLPANAGRYRISPVGATRTSDAADLTVGVAELASLYLGDVRPSTLAVVDAITVHDAAALDRADRLFALDTPPWSGTFF